MEHFDNCGDCGCAPVNLGLYGAGDLSDYEPGDRTTVMCPYCGQNTDGYTDKQWRQKQAKLRLDRIEYNMGVILGVAPEMETRQARIRALDIVFDAEEYARSHLATMQAAKQ